MGRVSYVDALLEAIAASRRSGRDISAAAVGHTGAVRDLKSRRDVRGSTLEALCRELGLEFYIGPPRSVSPEIARALGLPEACSTEEVLSAIIRLVRGEVIAPETDARNSTGECVSTRRALAEAKADAQGHADASQGAPLEAPAGFASELTAREIAELLGESWRYIQEVASREGWPFEPRRINGGIVHAFRVCQLPLDTYSRVLEAQAAASDIASRKEAEQASGRVAGSEKAKPARCRDERASGQYKPRPGSAPCR